MCGIIAVVGGEATAREAMTLACLDRIAHRGAPSGRGSTRELPTVPVTLGTNRLPIIGGASGTQPAISRSGAVMCAHNGEVYNFRALAEAAGLPPELSTSDTVVLTELLDCWGVERTLNAVRWEGALVAVDVTTGTVTAARDHLGIKPLYFATLPDATVLASELKALEPFGAVINEVPAGAFATFDVQDPVRVRTTTWWTAERSHSIASGRDPVDAIDDTVRAAVHARVPEEPYAVMLSGGLDSSLVLRHAIARNPDVTAFVLHRPGSPDVEVARRLCHDLDVRLVEVKGTSPEDLWQRAPEVVRIVESWEWHVVNHAAPMLPLITAIAEAGLRIVLTGEGADELYFGYIERRADGTPIVGEAELSQRRLMRLAQLGRTNCQRLDRMSMHSTIECRVPFLDREVIETALALTPATHCRNGVAKTLLKAAARRSLPDYVVNRPKLSLAKGAGYVYDQEHGGGVFAWIGDSASAEHTRAEVERFPYRFPVERVLVEWFVELGYHRAAFMRTATV